MRDKAERSQRILCHIQDLAISHFEVHHIGELLWLVIFEMKSIEFLSISNTWSHASKRAGLRKKSSRLLLLRVYWNQQTNRKYIYYYILKSHQNSKPHFDQPKLWMFNGIVFCCRYHSMCFFVVSGSTCLRTSTAKSTLLQRCGKLAACCLFGSYTLPRLHISL